MCIRDRCIKSLNKIFYLDFSSHRPLDLNNVFKEQIKILIKDGDTTIDDIPDPEKVIEYVR